MNDGSTGNLWEPTLDRAEWPEMRDYVSPTELDIYSDICRSIADANAAKGAKGALNKKPPPPPPRATLSLSDLAAAESWQAEQKQAGDSLSLPTSDVK